MTDDLATFDNPLHPKFVDDADGKKAARFEQSFRWLHAEAVQKHEGNLDKAREWVLRWRSEPDDVEAALMLAVAKLIDDAKEDKHRRAVRMVRARHERRMMATAQTLMGAA